MYFLQAQKTMSYSQVHPTFFLSGSRRRVETSGDNINLICFDNVSALDSIARYAEYEEILSNFRVTIVNIKTGEDWILGKSNMDKAVIESGEIMVDFSNSKEIKEDNCTVFSSFKHSNSEIIKLLYLISQEEKPAAILHVSGFLKAANKAWVELCECSGDEVVERDVSTGYMHPSTRKLLQERCSKELTFEARYSAYWSKNNFLEVVSQITRIEVSPGCWYSLNILQKWHKTDPMGLTFGG